MAGPPLCLLLLPSALEDFPQAAEVHDLLRAPAVVAVEPARLSYRRLSETLADMVAVTQARRLRRKLDGDPRVVVLFDALHYPLARAIVARSEAGELWYGAADEPQESRLALLHALAVERAALRFGPADPAEPAFRRNAPLWDRLEQLGIARR